MGGEGKRKKTEPTDPRDNVSEGMRKTGDVSGRKQKVETKRPGQKDERNWTRMYRPARCYRGVVPIRYDAVVANKAGEKEPLVDQGSESGSVRHSGKRWEGLVTRKGKKCGSSRVSAWTDSALPSRCQV